MILRCPACRANVPAPDPRPTIDVGAVCRVVCPKCDASLLITITIETLGATRP